MPFMVDESLKRVYKILDADNAVYGSHDYASR